ncbi:MAG: hypothetical protein WC822_03080 [Candidatus Paceibacterota bacterium]|jgi:hypothetical protein
MGQFFKKIIISVIITAIFLAPVSGIFQKKVILAQEVGNLLLLSGSSLKWGANGIKATPTTATFSFSVKGASTDWEKINSIKDGGDGIPSGTVNMKAGSIILVITDTQTNFVASADISTTSNAYAWTLDKGPIIENSITVGGLTADKSYRASLWLRAATNTGNMGKSFPTFPGGIYYPFGNPVELITPPADQEVITTGEETQDNYSLNCGISSWWMPGGGSLGGCVAGILYVVWEASAWVARMAGSFLDFFIYYSTNSSSYKNDFIEQGWVTVRDVANIFFIIALLFVAIKTILGLNVTNNKKLVGTVIMIALIINFSLFTTKIVIDASNILAKIFYNNINSKDTSTPTNTDGTPKDSVTGVKGEKSISIGLIRSYNPQKIISKDIYETKSGGGVGMFIFTTLLLLVITLYTAYIFFSVALLFVARVVSLWISMVFSPIAFISYTLPFDIPGFGHKEWWAELLKNTFLAPIFIFFLYIIILFTGFLSKIVIYTNSSDITTTANIMQRLMSVVIPFAIIFMLLSKAKGLAVKYSGEMGKAVMSAGKMIGGAALGVATGGTALLGRATLGRAGAAVANSQWAKRWESHGWGGEYVRRAGTALGSGSFDVRGAKIAGKTLAGATGLNLGEAQKGGFVEKRKAQIENRQKRAKELEVGEDETLTQELHEHENTLQELRAVGSHEIGEIDKRIEASIKADKAAQSALNAARGTPGEQAARETALTTSNRVRDLRQQRSNIKNANGNATNTQHLNTDRNNRQDLLNLAQQAGNANEIAQAESDLHSAEVALQVAAAAANNGNRSMNNYEDTIIPEAHHAIENESRRRKRIYANTTQGTLGQAKSFIFSGGQHSFRGAREAANKIRMEAKIEEKGGSGNGH